MVTPNKIFLYIPLTIIILELYRNSWLPGGHKLYGKEIFLILIISLAYVILVFDFNNLLNYAFRIFDRYNKYLLALIILFLISTIFYNVQEITDVKYFVRLIDFIFYFIIFFLIVPKIMMSNPQLFKRFVTIISVTGFLTSVLGLVLFFLDIHPVSLFAGTLISFIDQPNYVVFIFNLGIISSIYYLDWNMEYLSPLKKYSISFSIFLQLLAVLLTLSRGGYIGLFIGLSLYFLFKYKSRILLLFPIILMLIFLIVPPFFKAKGFQSYLSRFYLLIPAYLMIIHDKISLLWGYGLTNTFKVFLEYNRFNLSGESYLNNPHNVVVSLILMFGVIFTVLLITFVSLLLVRNSIRAFKIENIKSKFFHAYLVSVTVILIFQSLFDSEIIMPEFFSLQVILIFLGLMYSLENRNSYLLTRYISKAYK